ncbi:sulfite exporter TauE/SafE family protein [Spiractinospora alimapuensis]|uniref:sulfite exporter TauE/SafE family protein n=1 Tax=Spiractinospora alimapuensis TaxID=2820884 RepID=UPI001F461615|nr:sulfite exporter TauE/SafE family protein [Spiractinospora alimapuensis]QVQ50352.1 sulfite exporter TauE/SafE family protein [Spiractinospora alimapuensis]
MGIWEALAIAAAGVGAGAINAVVGSGTLLTFPVMLAMGFPPVTATVSNSIGLAPGAVAGAIGYRHELKGQRARLMRFAGMSLIGAIIGGTLLLRLPPEVFARVVPVLITLSCVLIVVQPWLGAWVRGRPGRKPEGGPLVSVGVLGAGIYGGYFAAAQGILLVGILGTSIDDKLQRINALKNALVSIVNITAAVFYIIFAQPSWTAVALIAVGSVIGGFLGGRFGRHLKPLVLRIVIVVIGMTAVVQLVVNGM